MRIVNTAQPRQTFLFCVRCLGCPTALGLWAVAWKVPETTIDKVFLNNYKNWLRCVVCLRPMDIQGRAVSLSALSELDLVAHLGREPAPGTIVVIG